MIKPWTTCLCVILPVMSIAIAKNTYRRWSNTASTCTKSHARIPGAWAAGNCRQAGDAGVVRA